jgi:protein SCO1
MTRQLGRPRVLLAATIAVLVVVVAGAAVILGLGRSSLPAVVGTLTDQPVPDIQLVNASGQPTSLAAFKGKVVVLAPFMTLCHEMCPMTTGNFLQLRAQLEKDGLANKVALVEATLDPERDTPARLAAYEKLTGTSWTLLTGSQASITALWKYFGLGYEKVPIGSPVPVDWFTNKPETYDIVHQDGLFFLGPNGNERIVLVASPNYQGTLEPQLAGLLNSTGVQNLEHPNVPLSWTVRQALDDVSVLLGRPVDG